MQATIEMKRRMDKLQFLVVVGAAGAFGCLGIDPSESDTGQVAPPGIELEHVECLLGKSKENVAEKLHNAMVAHGCLGIDGTPSDWPPLQFAVWSLCNRAGIANDFLFRILDAKPRGGNGMIDSVNFKLRDFDTDPNGLITDSHFTSHWITWDFDAQQVTYQLYGDETLPPDRGLTSREVFRAALDDLMRDEARSKPEFLAALKAALESVGCPGA